ncbi:SDR family NAD(P)-dependent oxidoreductase [Spongiibacter sp. KMU-158]|uniref:SDR family NAD(P)-dependent oxidoreductase n=1 Tax=Spongiibacter pelagi TaxID=2760804 RepID=A0A927C383_9GAMM|nr:SDR family NAD(P)-dependent oxidoreductase [Spongiibacter pelagi]MBD2858806.1 SDR family NAD(P)-dependent oxidoreductase [Spongiibacter pelagi]
MSTAKHNLITGAGSGLGLGVATRVLRRGENVSVLDLAVSDESRAKLDQAATQGKSSWAFFETNITNDERVHVAVNEAVDQFGSVDLALNCAGVVLNKTMTNMSGEEFKRVVDINLNGSFYFAHALIPKLKSGGRLAFIASLAGFTSNYAYTAYGASKAGVIALAKTLRYEYGDSDFEISCVCPPEVETPLVYGERAHGDPIALAIKEVGGCLNADFACDKILEGLDKGDWLIIPGFQAKLLAKASRFVPEFFTRYIQRLVRTHRKRLSAS